MASLMSYAAIRFHLPQFRLIKAGFGSSESMLLSNGPPGLTALDRARLRHKVLYHGGIRPDTPDPAWRAVWW
jgi:hypothetical protein